MRCCITLPDLPTTTETTVLPAVYGMTPLSFGIGRPLEQRSVLVGRGGHRRLMMTESPAWWRAASRAGLQFAHQGVDMGNKLMLELNWSLIFQRHQIVA